MEKLMKGLGWKVFAVIFIPKTTFFFLHRLSLKERKATQITICLIGVLGTLYSRAIRILMYPHSLLGLITAPNSKP